MSSRTSLMGFALLCVFYLSSSFAVGVGSALNTIDRVEAANALMASSPEGFAHFMAKIVRTQEALAILSAVGAVCSAGLAVWFLTAARKRHPCVTWDRTGRARSARIIPVQQSQRSLLLDSGYVPVKVGDRSLVGRKGLRLSTGLLMAAACAYSIASSVRANARKVTYESYVEHAERMYAFLQESEHKLELGVQQWVSVSAAIKKAEKVGCITQMILTFAGALMLAKVLTTPTTSKNIRAKEMAAGFALLFTLLSGYLIKPLITAGMRARAGVPSIDALFARASS